MVEYIEVSAKTVNEAITKACIDLGLTSEEIDYQVISEGNSGFLGFGIKPAQIRVCRKADLEAEARAIREAEEAEARRAAKEAEKAARAEKEKERKEANREKKNIDKKRNEKKKNNSNQPKEEVKPAPQPAKKERVVPQKTDEEIEQMKAAAETFLQGIFKSMDIHTDIVMNYDKEEGCLNVEFTGDDMGVLIGKRGQTLDSLQYLTSLVINKDNKDEYVRVKLDTEDYRRRRKETLENLAKNIAGKVKRTNKTVVLEPMNPYERRIIHSALQQNKNVETFSEGNEPYRHVVVKPVRNR
ncbi:MAG: protein jag [Lachnospiraceae bacterium]|nr:protein jag [Parasporobacterium sp.]MBR3396330.1 protein jag [Lachnospiraceae bacterium]